MTAFNLARGALAFIAHAAVEFCRPHRCHFGCGFRSHDISLMAQHVYTNHAGDRMAVPKEHTNG